MGGYVPVLFVCGMLRFMACVVVWVVAGVSMEHSPCSSCAWEEGGLCDRGIPATWCKSIPAFIVTARNHRGSLINIQTLGT